MKVLLILLATTATNVTYGQSDGGCIDLQRCISVLPEYLVEQSAMTARAAELDDTLKTLASEYQSHLMHGVPHGSKLDALAIVKATNELSSREAAIEKYVEYAKAALLELERGAEVRLRRMMVYQLGSYCEEKGLSFVVACDALLYGPGIIDHTEGFIEFMKQR